MTTKEGKKRSLKNLKTLDKRTPQERIEIARKGGQTSVKSKRTTRSMKQLIQMFLEMSPREEVVERVKHLYPNVDHDAFTNKGYILLRQLEKAEEGDSRAFEIIRDTGGEKPIDKVEKIDSDRKFSSLKIKDGETIIKLK